MSTIYDLIIVGTGAGGGTLLREIAPTGLSILVLERGDFLPREEQNWNPYSVYISKRYASTEMWLDDDERPFQPGMHYGVGGNTKLYGAALMRFRESDFQQVVHAGGASPKWPVNYEEFEPYYTRAEVLYDVRGSRGVDPTEPHASAPYPHAAISDEAQVAELRKDLTRIGLRPFSLPVSIMLNEGQPRSRCIRCKTCDGFPCLLGAKGDAEVVGVRPVLEYSNVTLLTQTRVTRLLSSPSGRAVRAVCVLCGSEELIFRAQIVVVACGAVNSAALLLQSACDQHPNGLANSSGQVGRNYMAHNSSFVSVGYRAVDTRFPKTLGINDFYHGSPDWPLPMGHAQLLGVSHAIYSSTSRAIEQTLDLFVCSEDLPNSDNRVELKSDGTIKLTYRENNLEGHERLVHRLTDVASERLMSSGHGMTIGPPARFPSPGIAHQCGTICFGWDPKTSVLDRFCRAHELDNLYVVDGSFFVSSAAVNPALTIMANSLRVADHLKARFGIMQGRAVHG